MSDYRVECKKCGARYEHKAYVLPARCAGCNSFNISVWQKVR